MIQIYRPNHSSYTIQFILVNTNNSIYKVAINGEDLFTNSHETINNGSKISSIRDNLKINYYLDKIYKTESDFFKKFRIDYAEEFI